MVIKKFHRNEGRDDFTSKTSIKLEAHALTKWGKQLVAEKHDLSLLSSA